MDRHHPRFAAAMNRAVHHHVAEYRTGCTRERERPRPRVGQVEVSGQRQIARQPADARMLDRRGAPRGMPQAGKRHTQCCGKPQQRFSRNTLQQHVASIDRVRAYPDR